MLWRMAGATTDHHTPKARVLGGKLRAHREAADLSGRALADELGIAQGTVSRYERGERTAPVEYVARVLGVLGVTGREYDEVVEFAENATEPNLVVDSRSLSGMHANLVELAEWERAATRMTHVAPLLVPGPFQTRAYAHIMMQNLPAEQRDVRIEMRMARREVLRSSAEVRAIIAERVLREPMGDTEVMREQVAHLIDVAEWPGVAVQVIPACVGGWTLAHNGACVVFEFGKTTPATVHLEHYKGPMFLHAHGEVEAYQTELGRLTETAMNTTDSVALMADIEKNWSESSEHAT